MTLDDAINYYDGIAKEYRANADIERNDYMDMRDGAFEADQLASWLNELKLLRERIEKHPEPCDTCTDLCMTRLEENKMVIERMMAEAEGKPTGTYEEMMSFQFGATATMLTDISKSLAILAYRSKSEDKIDYGKRGINK